MKPLRPLGNITGDLEPLLFEMAIDHDLQHQEILYLILSWLETHVPEGKPQYNDGHRPMMVYSHPSAFKQKPRSNK